MTIRPEISRTKTFGRKGTSHAQFFDKYLASIRLNTERVNWLSEDLSYLSKTTFDHKLLHEVEVATPVTLGVAKKLVLSPGYSNTRDAGESFKLEYRSIDRGQQPSFFAIARALGIMPDAKAKVPRGAYLGILSLTLPPADANDAHQPDRKWRRLYIVRASEYRAV